MWYNVASAIIFVVACLVAYRRGYNKGVDEGIKGGLVLMSALLDGIKQTKTNQENEDASNRY